MLDSASLEGRREEGAVEVGSSFYLKRSQRKARGRPGGERPSSQLPANSQGPAGEKVEFGRCLLSFCKHLAAKNAAIC